MNHDACVMNKLTLYTHHPPHGFHSLSHRFHLVTPHKPYLSSIQKSESFHPRFPFENQLVSLIDLISFRSKKTWTRWRLIRVCKKLAWGGRELRSFALWDRLPDPLLWLRNFWRQGWTLLGSTSLMDLMSIIRKRLIIFRPPWITPVFSVQSCSIPKYVLSILYSQLINRLFAFNFCSTYTNVFICIWQIYNWVNFGRCSGSLILTLVVKLIASYIDWIASLMLI